MDEITGRRDRLSDAERDELKAEARLALENMIKVTERAGA